MKTFEHQRINVIPNASGHRAFPTTSLSHFDPFVMLDHIGPSTMPNGWKLDGGTDDEPKLHPHRGFETITFMFSGNMKHRDSKFSDRPLLTNGSVQQMNAGSGIRHGGDMWADEHQQFHEVQLWVNSPAKNKMSEPTIHNVNEKGIPFISLKSSTGATKLRVIAGSLGNIIGPIKTFANIRIIHGIASGKHNIEFSNEQLNKCHNRTMLYMLTGSATIKNQTIHQFQTAAFEKILNELNFTVNEQCEFLLISGESINEPIVNGGPFVMNSEAEIEQAFQDYSNGVF
jgi:redox-sensitive bicupin YhaK (pirin superfamily)